MINLDYVIWLRDSSDVIICYIQAILLTTIKFDVINVRIICRYTTKLKPKGPVRLSLVNVIKVLEDSWPSFSSFVSHTHTTDTHTQTQTQTQTHTRTHTHTHTHTQIWWLHYLYGSNKFQNVFITLSLCKEQKQCQILSTLLTITAKCSLKHFKTATIKSFCHLRLAKHILHFERLCYSDTKPAMC